MEVATSQDSPENFELNSDPSAVLASLQKSRRLRMNGDHTSVFKIYPILKDMEYVSVLLFHAELAFF